MERTFPGNRFERYADDAIIHCSSQYEAQEILDAIGERLGICGLELNKAKTRMVYCKDANRTESHSEYKFVFLGYEFRPRVAQNRRGETFVSFLPAICPKAMKGIRKEMRSWGLQRRSYKSIEDLARMFDSKLRGWINYYGRYYRSKLHSVFRRLDDAIVRWACRKYKNLRGHRARAYAWLKRLQTNAPGLWAHWSIGGRCAGC